MKVIWILLMLLGILGVLMGCVMYGDIGIACIVCALSALLSGIGFVIVSRKIRSRGDLKPSAVQAQEGLGENKVEPSKKKFKYGCAVVVAIVVVLPVCIAIFSSGGGLCPSIEKASAAELAEEVKLGEQVLAWLKTAGELTGPQRSDERSRFEGKDIILQGEVKDVDEAFLSRDFYVVLNVGGEGFGEIDIQFDVVKSAEQEAKSLRKGQLVVMRGRITSQGEFPETPFVRLVCDNAEIVPETKYTEVIGPSPVEQMTSAELAEGVKLGEQMLAWLKTSGELTDQQRIEELSRFEGNRIILQGIVEKINNIFDIRLKVGGKSRDSVLFEVANSALQGTKSLRKGQLVVMRGRVTRREDLFVRLVCDNAEIVPEAKYKEAIGPSSVEQMTSAELTEEVKSGEQMLAWLKTKAARDLTDRQRSEVLSRFEGKNIIMQGVVKEFNDIFDAVLKVGKDDENKWMDVGVKFEIANSALQGAKVLRKDQLIVMRGRVTKRKGSYGVRLVCDNAEIVPETKYRKR